MKHYNIIVTKQFSEELDSILYYSNSSPNTLKKLYLRIKQSILNLKFFPERFYRISDDLKFKHLNIRKMPIDKFVIIYKVDKKRGLVFILHIFYGNQNYFNLI